MVVVGRDSRMQSASDPHWFILPRVQRHPRYLTSRTTGHALIRQVCLNKCQGLHHLQVVRVVTDDPGETRLADLVQLFLPEGRLQPAVLVVESVTKPESSELVTNDAEEGMAEEGAPYRDLADASNEDVDIIYVFIQSLQMSNYLWTHDIPEVVKCPRLTQPTDLPPLVVRG